MSAGKNYCSFFVQVTDKLCYEARAITPNGFGIGDVEREETRTCSQVSGVRKHRSKFRLLNFANAMMQEVRERQGELNGVSLETLLPNPMQRNRNVRERGAANVVPYSERSRGILAEGERISLHHTICISSI